MMMQWNKLKLEDIKAQLQSVEGQALRVWLEELRHDSRKGVQNLVLQVEKDLCRQEAERQRMARMWAKESTLRQKGYDYVAGIDEVGRGPLAGPVVAACVVLPSDSTLRGLKDSKLLSAHQREGLSEQIKKEALAWGIGMASHQLIDQRNILQATKRAMVEAVEKTSPGPDYLLIDALNLPLAIPQEGIVRGDSLCACIAAASIVAKTFRDALMDQMDLLYPQYGFKEHKGYGTPRHYEAIALYGPCAIHRKTFLSSVLMSAK